MLQKNALHRIQLQSYSEVHSRRIGYQTIVHYKCDENVLQCFFYCSAQQEQGGSDRSTLHITNATKMCCNISSTLVQCRCIAGAWQGGIRPCLNWDVGINCLRPRGIPVERVLRDRRILKILDGEYLGYSDCSRSRVYIIHCLYASIETSA